MKFWIAKEAVPFIAIAAIALLFGLLYILAVIIDAVRPFLKAQRDAIARMKARLAQFVRREQEKPR